MPSKREAYENLPPESQRCFRVICLEWAKKYADLSFATSDSEDRFIDSVLRELENGNLSLRKTGEGKDMMFSLAPTEKGNREIEVFTAEMN